MAVVTIRCNWLDRSNVFIVPDNLKETFTAGLAIDLLIKKEQLNSLCSYYLTKDGREVHDSERLVSLSRFQLHLRNRTLEKLGMALAVEKKSSPYPAIPLRIRCSGCITGVTLIDASQAESEFRYFAKLNEVGRKLDGQNYVTFGLGEHNLQVKVKDEFDETKALHGIHFLLGKDFLEQHVLATFPTNDGLWLKNGHVVKLQPPLKETIPNMKRQEMDKPAEIGRLFNATLERRDQEIQILQQKLAEVEQALKEKMVENIA